MPRKNTPDAMEELNAARGFIKRKRHKRKGWLFALLASAIVLVLALYGYILYRQRLLDLEAEAYFRAVQTATAKVHQLDMETPEAAPQIELNTQP